MREDEKDGRIKGSITVCGRDGRGEHKNRGVEICGRTYANRNLTRYDKILKAEPVGASSLSALVDYIATRSEEFPEGRNMILHIVSPKKVRLVSGLDVERGRECPVCGRGRGIGV